MEQVLGRELYRGETVHHKNGIRHDNRPENLELWVSLHPAGQRVSDLVAFAKDVLDRYGDVADRLFELEESEAPNLAAVAHPGMAEAA